MSSRTAVLYEALAFCCTAGFAAHDLRTRMVPDRALLLFCPLAALAPLANTPQPWGWARLAASLPPSLAGAAVGFLIPLAAAMASREGAGIGGGDIKLAAAMGYIYGPRRMMAVLLAASALAGAAALAAGRKRPRGELSLPFVPFLAAGSLAVTVAAAIR